MKQIQDASTQAVTTFLSQQSDEVLAKLVREAAPDVQRQLGAHALANALQNGESKPAQKRAASSKKTASTKASKKTAAPKPRAPKTRPAKRGGIEEAAKGNFLSAVKDGAKTVKELQVALGKGSGWVRNVAKALVRSKVVVTGNKGRIAVFGATQAAVDAKLATIDTSRKRASTAD